MVTDPIGDLLTRIQNAGNANIEKIAVPYSALKESVAKVLEREGYISSLAVDGDGINKELKLGIKYKQDKSPRVAKATRVSKPSRRMYTAYQEIKPFKYGQGHLILSTSKGILTDVEAGKQKVGGEILFSIW